MAITDAQAKVLKLMTPGREEVATFPSRTIDELLTLRLVGVAITAAGRAALAEYESRTR